MSKIYSNGQLSAGVLQAQTKYRRERVDELYLSLKFYIGTGRKRMSAISIQIKRENLSKQICKKSFNY